MHYRLLLGLVFCLGFTVTPPTLANSNKLVGTKLAFESYQITAPFKVSLPVLALDIAVSEQFPADELVVIGEDEQNKTWLAVYVFHEKTNSFMLLDKLQVADKYFAYDVSENEQGLYFLAKNEVVTLSYNGDLNEENGKEIGLFLQQKQAVNSIYLLNTASFIAKKDFIQDVNKDGLDDIILPDFEQTNLWLSIANTQEYHYQSLAISTQAELIRGSVNFKPTDLFLADFNVDGLQDIAWISQGHINYFAQISNGKFSSSQQTLSLAENIYGLNWWQLRESDGESPDQSNLTHRVVEQIKDINGDELVDVIVRFTQSSGVLDRANDYEFYLGFINETGQLEFPKVANTVIQAEGTLTGLNIVDVNNDKKFEVLLSSFELTVSNIIGALLSGGIDQNVLLFALQENAYEADARISKEVELSFSLTSGQSGQPIVLLTDVNGDSLQDLILSADEDRLDIFLGQKTERLFNRKASKHKFSLPKNGTLFEHYDINHDDKEDFIMRYGRLDDESMANKVTILMVK
ncbi:MAG: VCBS repeat-containing protein [Colwellia sp.]|nr:VCBS repeat-containing protein [Colwellia sp.]MCW8866129.1 VCBS repeat-containing protein [Colwellia sp.]MCW9082621.1 VCBS repeat-containing protein [Colwellia sp.]